MLKGKVVDESNEPLPFSTLYIKSTQSGTTANAEGEFVLHLPDTGSQSIIVRYVGFESVEKLF